MTTQPNLFTRNDTIFGACQGFADDLGIDPLWIRVPLASLILLSPKLAFGLYAALCLFVLVSRVAFPSRKAALVENAEATSVVVEPANEERELAAAA